ncbi:hypothetical protein [Streptomyces sp. NPDC004134]|uniref:hypothetical protein n=1 Tax=Streptomyces sp. NPDC004134 TaxID=3364691 RepID=UPI0036AA49B2
MRGTWARRLTGVATTLAIATGIGVVTEPTAAAAGYCTYRNDWASREDPGGRNAVAVLYRCETTPENYDYRALFVAEGEKLILEDRWTDEAEVASNLFVYRGRDMIDSDYLRGARTHHLGTPDGSGDIAEGLTVEFRVCARGLQCSYLWVYGTA